MQLPSADVFIGLFFLIGIAYGFILQRERAITALCSVYIGIVIASSFSQSIFEFFNGNKMVAGQLCIKGNASTSTIAIVLLLASIILISGAINSKANKSGDLSPLEIIIYSAFTVALILSSVLMFLPEATRNNYIEVSIAARYLYNYHTALVVIPPIMIILLNFRKKKNNS